MKLFFRQTCVFLLLLLQGFSPLVHAHVHNLDSHTGMHMHHDISEGVEIGLFMHDINSVDTIVSLGSIIKENKGFKTSFDTDYFHVLTWAYLNSSVPVADVHFFSITEPSHTRFKFPLSTPRAPPAG